jgi:DNA-binding GntR family transcriptional regulator
MDVYEQLRASILNGRLAPGERLKPAELSRHFEVSLGVMREALGLLGAHELIRIDRNRAFRVTPLSLDALEDLTFIRKLNEGAGLRLSIERGGIAWESEVLAAHYRMASQPMYRLDNPTSRNEEWARAHLAFHDKLIDACQNPRLLGICRRLSDAAELYRAWSGPGTREINRDVAGEHKGLLDAALAHVADLAVTLFEAHLDRTKAILAESSRPPGIKGSADLPP